MPPKNKHLMNHYDLKCCKLQTIMFTQLFNDSIKIHCLNTFVTIVCHYYLNAGSYHVWTTYPSLHGGLVRAREMVVLAHVLYPRA